jgi:diguanylate cyclase
MKSMILTLIDNVLENLAVLIAGLFLVSLTYFRFGAVDRWPALVARYLALVGTSFFALAHTAPLTPGILFDFRMVPVALAAQRHGRLAGLAVAIPVGIYRYSLGGVGAIPSLVQLVLLTWFAAPSGVWLHLPTNQGLPLNRLPWLALRLFAVANLALFVSFALANAPWKTAVSAYISLTVLSTIGMLLGHIAVQTRLTNLARTQHYQTLAFTDALTGAHNRRQFELDLEAAAPSTHLLLLDLDHFKSVNDTYGHDMGDQVLQAFVTLAQRCVRPDDRLYRLGGEEFGVLLSACPPDSMTHIAERIRAQMERSLALEAGLGGKALTVSGGLAVMGEDVMAHADQNLYLAKAQGRNRIESGLLVGESAS